MQKVLKMKKRQLIVMLIGGSIWFLPGCNTSQSTPTEDTNSTEFGDIKKENAVDLIQYIGTEHTRVLKVSWHDKLEIGANECSYGGIYSATYMSGIFPKESNATSGEYEYKQHYDHCHIDSNQTINGEVSVTGTWEKGSEKDSVKTLLTFSMTNVDVSVGKKQLQLHNGSLEVTKFSFNCPCDGTRIRVHTNFLYDINATVSQDNKNNDWILHGEYKKSTEWFSERCKFIPKQNEESRISGQLKNNDLGGWITFETLEAFSDRNASNGCYATGKLQVKGAHHSVTESRAIDPIIGIKFDNVLLKTLNNCSGFIGSKTE